jgi:hypothetical protein
MIMLVVAAAALVVMMIVITTTTTSVSEQSFTVRYAWRKSSVQTASRRERRVHLTQLDVCRG